MKIVIEYSFIVNFSIVIFVISLVSKVTKVPSRLNLLGGVFASVISLIYPLWDINHGVLAVLFVATISCTNLICFKYLSLKDYLEKEVLMILFSFLFGGGCLAIENLFGNISLFAVMLTGLVLFVAIKIVLRFRQRQNIIENFTYSVILKDKGEEIELKGFLDSGNMLYDTITKKPIMLVDFEVFHRLYSNIPYFKILTKTFDEASVKNGHYIKVNSLSAGTSMLVFSVEEAVIGDKRHLKEPMLGLSLSGFEKGFGRSVLLHSELV